MSDESAMALLDAVVCFAGEWEDARLIGLGIARNDRPIQDNRLAGYVAAVLAATTVPGSCDDDLRSAVDLCSSTHWVSIDRDAGYRYQTQIRTNLAQVLWKLELRAEAHQTLEANLNLTATVHTSSRSEAVSIAAYYLYLHGRFEAGRRHVTEAIRLIAREGAPSRLSKTRKIAAAICDSMGDHEMTNVYLAAITTDPTGLAEYSHGA